MLYPVNPLRSARVCLLLALLVLAGCDHPLEVRGQGHIVSASGTRDCSWRQQPCSNIVAGAYQESYSALPEAGWQFIAWEGCSVATGDCSFDVAQSTVHQYWGRTMPALVAVFEPLLVIEVDAGSSSTVQEGSEVILHGVIDAVGIDQNSLDIRWIQLDGRSVSLSASDTLTPAFTAPSLDSIEQLVFKLEVAGPGITTASDVVVISVAPAPSGSAFIDDFSSNSLGLYSVTQGSSNPQAATLQWLGSSEQLLVTTGDNTRLTLQTFVTAARTGILQIDIRPFKSYPSGGKLFVKLLQDEYNYYLVENTDGYGPGQLSKYVDGNRVDSTSLPAEYFQNAEFDLKLYFSPSRLTLSGLPDAASLTGNSSPLSINSISITLHQQDAYIDNIIYTTTGIAYLLAFGDSITSGEEDDVPGNGIGFVPPLEELLYAATSEHHAVFNEGVPGHRASDGAGRIEQVLQRHPAADTVLVQFGSNDSRVPVPGGLGLGPGDSGYSGSFKDYMQRIIDSVHSAGKEITIARPPAKTGANAQYNDSLENYGDVIDELRDENGISAASPDFYCYFSAHPEHLADDVHPNDDGYYAMAGIWRNMLLGWGSECAP